MEKSGKDRREFFVDLICAGVALTVGPTIYHFGKMCSKNADWSHVKPIQGHAKDLPISELKKIEKDYPEFKFGGYKSYFPAIGTKARDIFEGDSNAHFEIKERNGKGISGLYVPTNYMNRFDGGWKFSRRDVVAKGLDYNSIKGSGESKELSVIVNSGILPSKEFKGLYPLVVPKDAFPSKPFAKQLRRNGHSIYTDELGRFFSTIPCRKLEVTKFSGHLDRMDNFPLSEYSGLPEEFILNKNGKIIWEGEEISGNYIMRWTPTWLRRDGSSFSRISKIGTNRSGFVPIAYREDKDNLTGNVCTFSNPIVKNIDNDYLSQIEATRIHYTYPGDSLTKKISSNHYLKEMSDYYNDNGKSGVSLLEFLNVMHIADCDVANAELMLRFRDRFLTRLGHGYLTDDKGCSNEAHGWCEVMGEKGSRNYWLTADGTPKKDDYQSNGPIEFARKMRQRKIS